MDPNHSIAEHAFRHRVEIHPDDIDENGHVNNVVYVRWVQEVAIAHWKQSSEKVRSQYAWVLLRHEIDYRNPSFLNEPIEGLTWVGKYEGPKIERFVKIINTETGKTLAESKTLWCLLDSKNLKPKRIEADILTSFQVKE